MPDSELDRIDPEPNVQALQSGLRVEVARIKTRQFFRLLKILTHGAGQALIRSNLNFNDPGEDFAQRLLSLVLFSIPDAENEAIEFVQSMVKPLGLHAGPDSRLSKAQIAANEQLWTELGVQTFNPELDDLITIIEAVVKAEAGDIQALGKRLAALLALAGRTGQDKPGTPETPPAPEDLEPEPTVSSASSPQSLISSVAITGGATSTSSGSGSVGSGRSRKLSPADAIGLTSSQQA